MVVMKRMLSLATLGLALAGNPARAEEIVVSNYGVSANGMPYAVALEKGFFKEAGLAPQRATLISALFPLGGVGAVLFGMLMDRFNPNRVIAVGYALTAVTVYAIGQSIGNVGWLMVSVFAAGILMNTAQSSMPALAAAFYPTQGRATGVAWMLGIGRFGGIAGSFLVAELTRRQFSFAGIFTVVAVAGVVACVALLIKQAVHPVDAAAAPVDRSVSAH